MIKYLQMVNVKSIIFVAAVFVFMLFPSCFAYSSMSSDYLLELGKYYLEKGNAAQAEIEFKKVLIVDSGNLEARSYIKKIREEKARQALDYYSSTHTLTKNASSSANFTGEFNKEPLSQGTVNTGAINHVSGKSKTARIAGNTSYNRNIDYMEKVKNNTNKNGDGTSGWFKVSGEYRISAGFTSDDVIWKDANADKQGVPGEKNYRYLWGKNRYNAFDRKIYSEVKVNIDSDFEPSSPWSLHSQIAIDPWTFIGVAEVDAPRSRSIDSSGGITTHSPPADWVHIKLKYWSGSNTTIDEVYRSDNGNIVNLPEIKVNDGHTPLTWATGAGEDWTMNGSDDHWGQFEVSSSDIDYMYRPLRELFITYTENNFTSTLFPFAYQDKAYTSDDPLKLSNNHLWWEESPWIEEFQPSVQYTRTNNPIERARWVRRYAFVAKDSDLQRLTFLRGFSIESYPSANTTLNFTAASPMSLWDKYTDANSIEDAFRFKWIPFDKIALGFISTAKLGLNSGSLEGENYLWGTDYNYKLAKDFELFGEAASTYTRFEEADGYDYAYQGYAFTQGIKFTNGKFFWAYMNKQFYPGLSNYRYTRRDPYYSRHIHFFDLNPEDEAVRIGDSIDIGRQVVGLKYEKDFRDKKDHILFDFRNAHKDSGKYIESIFRTESTSKLNNRLTIKTLTWYKSLPKTHAGLDPLINTKNVYYLTDYFSDRDEPIQNQNILDGKDPSIGHFSIGAKYDFANWFSLIQIYERTNDPGIFPRALLSTSWYENDLVDGRWYDKMVPALYDQGFFDLPPYSYYSILKLKALLYLGKNLNFVFTYTKNTDKYEAGIDDNINHFGVEIEYHPRKEWKLWVKYIYSRFIDLYRQVNGEGINYDGHNNLFLGARYTINQDQYFDIMFGEFVGYDSNYELGEWSLSAMDTQHMVRIAYKRNF